MRAVFFTAADPEIGLGHLFRCDALAQALTMSGVTTELLVDSASGSDWIAKKYLNTAWRIFRWKQDSVSFLARLNECNIPIFDAYNIDDSIWNVVREAERPIVVFDDFGEKPALPGVLINGSPGAWEIEYVNIDDRKLWIGPTFQVLRKPFWTKPKRENRSRINEVGVILGGTDHNSLLPVICRTALDSIEKHTRLYLIGTDGNKHYMNDSRIVPTGQISASSIRNLFTRIDFLLSSAGQSVAEAVACWCPAVIIKTANNQKYNYLGYGNNPFLIGGDYTEKCGRRELKSAIKMIHLEKTREEISLRCKTMKLHMNTTKLANAIKEQFKWH